MTNSESALLIKDKKMALLLDYNQAVSIFYGGVSVRASKLRQIFAACISD